MKNIVTESITNVLQGVCDGAAHQMRMIKRALSEKRMLLLFMFLFLFVVVHVVFPTSFSLSLSLYSLFSLINVLHSVAGLPP